jgi:ribosomal-protein-alanine N-acetyltransferase
MIRKAKVDDIPNLVRIEKQVFEQSLGESFLYDEFLLNPFAHYFVYEINHLIVGYIGYRAIDTQSEMMNFCVDPVYQGKKIGSELLEHTIDYLINLGVKTILLEVRVSNVNAINMYKKFGFKQGHVRKKYYGNEDAYVFMKEV